MALYVLFVLIFCLLALSPKVVLIIACALIGFYILGDYCRDRVRRRGVLVDRIFDLDDDAEVEVTRREPVSIVEDRDHPLHVIGGQR